MSGGLVILEHLSRNSFTLISFILVAFANLNLSAFTTLLRENGSLISALWKGNLKSIGSGPYLIALGDHNWEGAFPKFKIKYKETPRVKTDRTIVLTKAIGERMYFVLIKRSQKVRISKTNLPIK